jgi:hypothetical protein
LAKRTQFALSDAQENGLILCKNCATSFNAERPDELIDRGIIPSTAARLVEFCTRSMSLPASSIDELNRAVFAAGWVPGAPYYAEAPTKDGRNVKDELLERYERRATSRRTSAVRRFDAARFIPVWDSRFA